MTKKPVKKKTSENSIEKPKHPGGRPTKYNQEIANEICKIISTTSSGIKKLCRENPHLPDHTTIFQWRFEKEEFSRQYDDAKKAQIEILVEELREIADDSDNDTMINPDTGREVVNNECVQRSRLKLDTRKWLASKLLPKLYGEKQTVDTTVIVKHEDKLKELE